MLFKLFALSALAVAIQSSPTSNAGSWNQLAGSAIFHPSIDSVQSKSLGTSALIAELNELLGQDEVLDSVYNNYLIANEKEVSRSFNSESKETFKNTLISIIKHNLEAEQGIHAWTEAVNQFSDMSSEEYSQYLGLTSHPSEYFANAGIPQVEADLDVNAPADKDWKHKATPVKNQGNCGSCYAFAGVGALECNYNIKNSKVLDLSEQQVVDCSGNSGCNGGSLEKTDKYLQTGITSEAAYPYKTKQGECNKNVKAAGPKVLTYSTIQSEGELVEAVAKGCVFIALDAGCPGFQSYSDGILTDCSQNLNHGVVAVGYGTENGLPFWNIKNSWGSGWGKAGYIKIYRGNETAAIGQWSTPITTN